MVKNLLQKILEGKYTNQELDDIIEHTTVAKQTYEYVNNKIKEMEKDEISNKMLKSNDEDIKNLKKQIIKENKKQSKYILGLCSVGFPTLIALGIISAFNLSFAPIAAALGVAITAVGAIPIGIIDYKRKKLLAEIDKNERERALLLSGVCFSVTPDFAKNAYNDYKKSKTNELTTESTIDEDLLI